MGGRSSVELSMRPVIECSNRIALVRRAVAAEKSDFAANACCTTAARIVYKELLRVRLAMSIHRVSLNARDSSAASDFQLNQFLRAFVSHFSV